MRNLISVLLLFVSTSTLAGGKLLATPGVSQVEGSAGGGLVPWAQLAGYATEDEVSASAFCTHAKVDDFQLDVCGAQVNVYDRVEFSYAEQRFDVEPLSLELKQRIFGTKFRLFGDLIYSPWPQVSLGVQHKFLETEEVAFALGAEEDQGTDVYLAASKLHLGAAFGYNLLWNTTLRHTKANEMGLLGFGGPDKGSPLHAEASAAVLLNKHFAIGIEYRQKPDNLGLEEDDWQDLFVAWFPNKHVSLTAAYLDLGAIAAVEDQTGWYISLTGYL